MYLRGDGLCDCHTCGSVAAEFSCAFWVRFVHDGEERDRQVALVSVVVGIGQE
jgi:hypothetical protein